MYHKSTQYDSLFQSVSLKLFVIRPLRENVPPLVSLLRLTEIITQPWNVFFITQSGNRSRNSASQMIVGDCDYCT